MVTSFIQSMSDKESKGPNGEASSLSKTEGRNQKAVELEGDRLS